MQDHKTQLRLRNISNPFDFRNWTYFWVKRDLMLSFGNLLGVHTRIKPLFGGEGVENRGQEDNFFTISLVPIASAIR